MCLATAFNILGVIPGVGIPIGIGRICYALKQSRQQRVNAVGEEALAALKRATHREVFHGFCEIIPLFGPLLYGALKLYQRCAKKANNQGQNILGAAANGAPNTHSVPPVTPPVTTQSSGIPGARPLPAQTGTTGVLLEPPAAPIQPPIAKIIAMPAPISLEGVTTCASLRSHIGRKIAINVFPNAVPVEQLKDLIKTPKVLFYEGVLKHVSGRLANGTHAISLDPVTCTIPGRLLAGPVDLTVTDAELAEANKADQDLEGAAKEFCDLSALLGED